MVLLTRGKRHRGGPGEIDREHSRRIVMPVEEDLGEFDTTKTLYDSNTVICDVFTQCNDDLCRWFSTTRFWVSLKISLCNEF